MGVNIHIFITQGRLLWMGGSGPHADLLKTTWKELMSRRYELLRRNFAVL